MWRVIFFAGCASLKPPVIEKNGAVDSYQYVVVPQTGSLSSGSGATYGGTYTYGATTRKEVNPASVIEGILLKRGLISVPEVKPEDADKTLVVKYGESGRRDVAGGLGGYTLEVTILFISAETDSKVYFCTAEGQGETEADDLREAITRCLSGL